MLQLSFEVSKDSKKTDCLYSFFNKNPLKQTNPFL